MRLFLIGFLLIITSGACNNSNELKSINPGTTSFVQDTADSVGVAHESVCMVNNKFLGEKQIPVILDSKIYYGCCKSCKKKLEVNLELRTATDPYSHQTIDKAIAFIAITGEDGTVSYFESAENHKKFVLSIN
ncbi:MAG: TRASH domain-containing protein [Bacteroidia bacterium]